MYKVNKWIKIRVQKINVQMNERTIGNTLQ